MVKILAGRIVLTSQAVYELMQAPCEDPGLALKLAGIARAIQPLVEDLLDQENRILDEAGAKRDEEGNLIPRKDPNGISIPGTFVVEDPEKVGEQFMKLRQTEMDIPVSPISSKLIQRAKVPITGQLVYDLGDLIELEE